MIYLLLNPHLLLLPFKGIYLPVYIQFVWLKKYKIDVIVDVGAYQGHVSKTLNYLFPKAKIYTFEPLEENFKRLKKTLKSKKFIIEKMALSNKTGNSIFYTNGYLPASSILPLEEKCIKRYPYMANTKKTTVKTTTLDSYFRKKRPGKVVFLKIDTQGTEDLVLKGGREFLKNVFLIHVETSFDKMYQNQCIFQDIYELLVNLGFSYIGEARESQFYPTFGSQTSANSIFINNFLKNKLHSSS